MIITIDGPVASGKSTIAQMLADRLKFFCLYSGMLYRAVSYILIHDFDYTVQTISNATEEYVKAAVDSERFKYLSGGKILFDGKEITTMATPTPRKTPQRNPRSRRIIEAHHTSEEEDDNSKSLPDVP